MSAGLQTHLLHLGISGSGEPHMENRDAAVDASLPPPPPPTIQQRTKQTDASGNTIFTQVAALSLPNNSAQPSTLWRSRSGYSAQQRLRRDHRLHSLQRMLRIIIAPLETEDDAAAAGTNTQ